MDDLSAPLGQSQPKPQHFMPAGLSRAIAFTLAFCLLAFVLWAAVVEDPFGGEPVAVAPVPRPVEASAPAARVPPESERATVVQEPADKSASSRTVTIIDGMSGKRQDMVIGGSSEPTAPIGRRHR